MKELLIAEMVPYATLVVCLHYFIRRRWRKGLLWTALSLLSYVLLVAVASNSFLSSVLLYHFSDSTVYSSRFNAAAFRSIEPGQSAATVESLLGPALRTVAVGAYEIDLEYTKQGARSRYHWRKVIVLDRPSMRVRETISYFDTPGT
jgi:hypothetical protein